MQIEDAGRNSMLHGLALNYSPLSLKKDVSSHKYLALYNHVKTIPLTLRTSTAQKIATSKMAANFIAGLGTKDKQGHFCKKKKED